MPATEYQEIAALLLVFVVHLIGGVLLVWALLDADTRSGWRRRWGRGGPGDDGPGPQPDLAADQSAVRLRGPGRLADAHPRPPRRPDHVPEPARSPR